MYAIASLLDPISDQLVRNFWARFEQSCGLTGIRSTPVPHVSWMSAQDFQVGPVEAVLRQAALDLSPITIHTAGLGIFTGHQPVVYIPVVKDEQLSRLHARLWENIQSYAIQPNVYYHPVQWIPHITIVNYEVNASRLGCAVEETAFEEIGFEVTLRDFTILFRRDGSAGLQSSFPFMGGAQAGG